MSKDYYVGLDIGTSSVGFAVTDTNYNIIRKKGKDFWGVRLFDEANTAAERRAARTSRRRLQRKKMRIGYLRKIFEPEIAKIDPGFIQRLNDSKFFEDDKQVKQPFALFTDKKFTDKEYFEKYPTIFHLRKELIESDEPHDVRLVYLALLNIFKHRGHFLNESLSEEGLGDTGNLKDLFQELSEISSKIYTDAESDTDGDGSSSTGGWVFDDIETAQKILQERKYTNSEKHEEILKLFDVDKKTEKNKVEALGLICGLKRKINVIFDYLEDKFNDENKVSFRESNFEEKKEKLHQVLNDDEFSMILTLKDIHDSAELSQILSGDKYLSLSHAKVEQFEKHNNDLKLLKELFKKYLDKKEYNKFFRSMEDNTYSAYVGSVNCKNSKIRRGAKSVDFFNELKKTIGKIKEKNENEVKCEQILRDIDSDNFLPKQLTTANSVIPYQCYLAEVKHILNNAEAYLDFLKVKDNSGLTAKERLIEIFKFRIPYYIGPLKKSESSNGWVERKDRSGPVYPWNFNEKIDEKTTAENFIDRLINHCTYLSDKPVMPKNSLLYEKYKVLNELNNLKINDTKISVDLKQKIYVELFRKSGKVITTKKLLNFLKNEGVIGYNDTEDCLSGYDKELKGFVNTLANYHKFMEIFEVDELTDEQFNLAEDIIYYSTIYGDSKKFLHEKIEEINNNRLTDEQIKRIVGYKFKDWGNFSKDFLYLKDKQTNEGLTIIQRMWQENLNLTQILSGDYTYIENINPKKIEKDLNELKFEDIDDTYLSAPVKRMVWQTIKIMKEIVTIMGCEPKHIFIEMTRSDGEKNQRKDSRKKKLLGLYKKCKDDNDKILINKLEGTDDRELRIKKLYLYYMQKGKCMYSGEQISLDKLMDDKYYDIDHIYPRCVVKDDSLENNLVLVKSELNKEKGDKYPIKESVRNSQKSFWNGLKLCGFISSEKFKRLTGHDEFSDEDLTGFINRQLVETGQGTKQAADILKNAFSKDNKDTDKVIYVKAQNVSEFRKDVGFFKNRLINNLHHAKDAYLNIVVGNGYFTKFTLNPKNFISKYVNDREKYKYHVSKLFEKVIERDGNIAWDPQKDLSTVKKIMNKNSPIITRKVDVAKGLIHKKLQPIPAKKIKNPNSYLPIKSSLRCMSDVQKYGGYTDIKGNFYLVEHKVKGKIVRTMEVMPLNVQREGNYSDSLKKYSKEILGLIDPVIRIECIPYDSLLMLDGYKCYLKSRKDKTLGVRSAIELFVDHKTENYLRSVCRAVENKFSNEFLEGQTEISKKVSNNNNLPLITKKDNEAVYNTFLEKYKKGVYHNRPNGLLKILEAGYEEFLTLDLSKQATVLYNILSLENKKDRIDLSLINGGSETGREFVSNKISKYKSAFFIEYSTTGMFCAKYINLLTV